MCARHPAWTIQEFVKNGEYEGSRFAGTCLRGADEIAVELLAGFDQARQMFGGGELADVQVRQVGDGQAVQGVGHVRQDDGPLEVDGFAFVGDFAQAAARKPEGCAGQGGVADSGLEVMGRPPDA